MLSDIQESQRNLNGVAINLSLTTLFSERQFIEVKWHLVMRIMQKPHIFGYHDTS
ncbi:MAG: hypothetical protein ACK58L_20845 [Planctomycetota bacterium]